jgi:hypothetical protein
VLPNTSTKHSVLTGPIQLGPEVQAMALVPTDEPIFYRMVTQWGYEPLNIPWTGEQISEGRVLTEDEV